MLEINKNVEKLLNKIQAKFEPEIVPIRIESYSEVLDCYGNVEKKSTKMEVKFIMDGKFIKQIYFAKQNTTQYGKIISTI